MQARMCSFVRGHMMRGAVTAHGAGMATLATEKTGAGCCEQLFGSRCSLLQRLLNCCRICSPAHDAALRAAINVRDQRREAQQPVAEEDAWASQETRSSRCRCKVPLPSYCHLPCCLLHDSLSCAGVYITASLPTN